ncbi:condensation domain-containing protein [Streptomyces sp. KL116D]|uniref:condensation domain-containing protein n=1 Tax=Streptomyces sp. KL116D TaxID=3045152 RepID=UPI00355784EE
MRTTFHGDGDDPFTRVEPLTPVHRWSSPTCPRCRRPPGTARCASGSTPRRCAPSTCPRTSCCGRACCASPPTGTCCGCRCTTSPTDGWSLGVLLRELGALYPAFSTGALAAARTRRAVYADYAAWLNERMREPAHEDALRGWVDRLQGASALDLPTDRPRRESGTCSRAARCR